jgi:multiple sugar transport system permease protein
MRRSIINKISVRIDSMKDSSFSYLISSPALVIFLAFGLVPIIYSFGLSMTKYRLNIPGAVHFIGLSNYIEAFKDEIFVSSLLKTLYYSIGTVSLSVALGLVMALVLNQSFVGKKLFLIIMLIPWAIPKVVNGLMWKWIYDGNFGIFNAILKFLGIIKEYQWWFVESAVQAMTMVIVSDVWKNVSFAGLLLLAALQTVPASLYEAARCDGAGAWRQFKHITLPGVKYTLMVVLMLQTMWSLKAFDLIYALTRGGPGTNTTITYFYVFQQAFDYLNIGYGSALAYLVTIIIVVFLLVYNKTLGRSD